jgi:hypothetical protein
MGSCILLPALVFFFSGATGVHSFFFLFEVESIGRLA